ncbi:MAG: CarboxypepD reg-like domain, partial [Bacteroidota bacterium]
MVRIHLLFLVLILSFSGFSQRFLKGTVVDEKQQPIPYAKLYVKNDPSLRTVCDVAGYFEMGLMPGE